MDKKSLIYVAGYRDMVGSAVVVNQSAQADFMYDNMILEMNVIHAA